MNAVTATVGGVTYDPGLVLVPDDATTGGLQTVASDADIDDGMKSQELNQLFKVGVLGEPAGGNQFLTRVYLSPPRTWRRAVIVSEDGANERERRRNGIQYIALLGPLTGDALGDFNAAAAVGQARTQFELRTVPMAGEQPRTLPADTAIDLLGSARLGGLPATWFTRNTSTGAVALNEAVPFEILFDPAGTVAGDQAAAGLIHLPVVSFQDLDGGGNGGIFPAGSFTPVGWAGDDTETPNFDGASYFGPGKAGEEFAVTVNTATGTVTVGLIDRTDRLLNVTLGDPTPTRGRDGLADDPFFFAENGGETAR